MPQDSKGIKRIDRIFFFKMIRLIYKDEVSPSVDGRSDCATDKVNKKLGRTSCPFSFRSLFFFFFWLLTTWWRKSYRKLWFDPICRASSGSCLPRRSGCNGTHPVAFGFPWSDLPRHTRPREKVRMNQPFGRRSSRQIEKKRNQINKFFFQMLYKTGGGKNTRTKQSSGGVLNVMRLEFSCGHWTLCTTFPTHAYNSRTGRTIKWWTRSFFVLFRTAGHFRSSPYATCLLDRGLFIFWL